MRSASVLLCIAALITACNRGAAQSRSACATRLRRQRRCPREAARQRSTNVASRVDALKPESPTGWMPPHSDAGGAHDERFRRQLDDHSHRPGERAGRLAGAGIRAVRALAGRVGGYIANSSIMAGTDQTHSATLEIKIPAARFDDAISGLQPIGISNR